MGYRIRVLGTSAEVPTHAELQEAASPAILEIEGNPQHPWEQLVLKHGGGDPIALIERNPVVEGELGFDEIEEFIEEVGDYQPTSAADWLKRYLPTVKVIYSFQLLSGTEENDGFTRLHQVYGTVWRKAGHPAGRPGRFQQRRRLHYPLAVFRPCGRPLECRRHLPRR